MFVDKFMGDDFINVSFRVGKTGNFDDLLFVQMMLKFLFENNTTLKKVNPVKGPISVTGKPAPDTPILIASYQKHMLHRAKPQGFINKAVGNENQKFRFTIVKMNLDIGMLLAALRSPFQDIFELMASMSPFSPAFLVPAKR